MNSDEDTLMRSCRFPGGHSGSFTRFVWIAGPSSIGKRTLIDKCLADPFWCCQLFGLGECTIIEARYRRATENNPDAPNAEAIADIVAKADASVDAKAVLIHWQAVSRTAVPYLQKERPDDHHIVVHLHRDRARHLKSYLDDYRRKYDSDDAAMQAFEYHGQNDRGYVEAYRGLVHGFIDVAVISRDYFVI